jgi:hypothetical protein
VCNPIKVLLLKVEVIKMYLYFFFITTGAVFNLLSTEWEKTIMEKIENHFQHFIPEVISALP